MDFEVIAISVGVVAISAIAIIGIFMMFGLKEKTYEEAIAEQRKLPDENLLISRSVKEKSKEKKHKKPSKKVKEKLFDHEHKENEKVRVEFEKPEAEIVSDRHPQEEVNKKRKKRDKLKPILINKNECPLVVESPVAIANHFEEIHPKDDLLLKLEETKEEVNAKASTGNEVGETKKNVDSREKFGKSEKQSAKGDKVIVPPKTEKSTSTDKVQPAPTSEKVKEANETPVNIEKPASKLEKERNSVEKTIAPTVKPEKNSVKPEKVASTKTEKLQNLVKDEKPAATAKLEKSSASPKAEKSQPTVADKSMALTNSDKIQSPSVEKPTGTLKTGESVSILKTEKTVVNTQENGTHAHVGNKEQRTKKKKNEITALQQLSVNNEGINVSLLLPLINKAELSRSEIQIMIDLLLNKQQGAAAGNSEWVEGRQDPVMKLKKQLAETEKALAVKQEEILNHQNKLKELRVEFNSERSRLNQSCRQMEEALIGRQNEVQVLTARLQHSNDMHNSEKQTLSQQIQQLQAQNNEDRILLRKLQEEKEQTQEALKAEFVKQRQHLELHISQLGESEAAHKAQINQLHAKLQEQSNLLIESQRAKDNEIQILREQFASVQDSVEKCREFSRQLEESRRLQAEAEHQLACYQKNHSDQDSRLAALQGELDRLITDNKNLKCDLEHSNKELSERISCLSAAQQENEFLRSENQSLHAQVTSLSQQELELQKVREENEFLSSQIASVTERPAAEGRENGDIHHSEQMFLENEKLTKEKDEIQQHLSSMLKEKESVMEKLLDEITSYKTEIKTLNEELEAQKERNNGLRTKNWKVMEALSAAEKNLESRIRNSEKIVSDSCEKVRLEQQNITKQLLQRIFPEVTIDNEKIYETWIERFESNAKSLLQEIRSSSKDNSNKELETQVCQLQSAATHYKKIIEETEGMLNKLQKHVEEEEAKWLVSLQNKDVEIEGLKERLKQQGPISGEELQSEVIELKTKLKQAQEEKDILHKKYEEISNKYEALSNSRRNDLDRSQQQNAALQLINEERDHLSSQFETDKLKIHNAEDVSQLKHQLHNGNLSVNSEPSLLAEEVSHSNATNGSTNSTLTQSVSKAMQSLIKRKQKKSKKGSSAKK